MHNCGTCTTGKNENGQVKRGVNNWVSLCRVEKQSSLNITYKTYTYLASLFVDIFQLVLNTHDHPPFLALCRNKLHTIENFNGSLFQIWRVISPLLTVQGKYSMNVYFCFQLLHTMLQYIQDHSFLHHIQHPFISFFPLTWMLKSSIYKSSQSSVRVDKRLHFTDRWFCPNWQFRQRI